MNWRRVPPVFSPIAPWSLLRGSAAYLGLMAERVDVLTAKLSAAFDAREVVLTDSGTSALVLALRSVAPAGGDVAFPAYGCIDLIAAAVRANVRVALYDVDPETLSPDLDSVRGTLARGVRALVVAPLYGYPPDMRRLVDAAVERGVPLIEDAAQAAGATLDGKRVGAFGDLTILSFGRGKGTTAGSGGALLVRGTSDAATAAARPTLEPATRGGREILALAAQWLLARPALYAIPSAIPALRLGEMVYHPAGEPRALSNAATAILDSALSIDAREVSVRRNRAAALLAASSASRRFTPIRPLPGAQPGYLRLAVLDATDKSAAAAGLGVLRGYPITLDEHQETQRVLARGPERLAGARVLRDRLVTLPTHSRLTDHDVANLAAWLGATAEGRGIELQTNEAV